MRIPVNPLGVATAIPAKPAVSTSALMSSGAISTSPMNALPAPAPTVPLMSPAIKRPMLPPSGIVMAPASSPEIARLRRGMDRSKITMRKPGITFSGVTAKPRYPQAGLDLDPAKAASAVQAASPTGEAMPVSTTIQPSS